MPSACFEPEGSSSGRRLYVQVWYSVFTRQRYRGADKSLARILPDVFCLMIRIFRLMLVLLYIYIYIYIYSTNIPPIMIINRIYETQNLLSL